MKIRNHLNFNVLIIVFFLVITQYGRSQSPIEESKIKVALRMIGHEVLLNVGDSNSLVLPIEKTEGRYKIAFESDLEFEPDALTKTTQELITNSGLFSKYIVEVEQCESMKVVYSFAVNLSPESGIIPCKSRAYEQGCYQIYLTILEEEDTGTTSISRGLKLKDVKSTYSAWLKPTLILSLLLLIIAQAFRFYLKRKTKLDTKNSNIINIGQYQFDKNNSVLIHIDNQTELTTKEADLLVLLYNSANEVITREQILKKVWGDEGDYIGRTLDVFISKLRKKLSQDTSLKIINVRSVGYKLHIGPPSKD